jgi:pantoate--beta-alanine ligase
MTDLIASSQNLRARIASWQAAGETVALVPTMGALHAGHIALVTTALAQADRVVVSIFVNPTQFGPQEDFSRYPRQLEADHALLGAVGTDAVFVPEVPTIYPPGFATRIDPGTLATLLEGAVRPGHFAGVATVVTRLLMLLRPDQALFGEKDYQQLLVIQQTVRDLALPISIHGVPTVRAEDGLALSSRNAYLTAAERITALTLSATLRTTAAQLAAGTPVATTLAAGSKAITQAGFALDYLALADATTLAPATTLAAPTRLLVAAKIGTTRLIDNWPVPATNP